MLESHNLFRLADCFKGNKISILLSGEGIFLLDYLFKTELRFEG